jgi:hypothetical protein
MYYDVWFLALLARLVLVENLSSYSTNSTYCTVLFHATEDHSAPNPTIIITTTIVVLVGAFAAASAAGVAVDHTALELLDKLRTSSGLSVPPSIVTAVYSLQSTVTADTHSFVNTSTVRYVSNHD